MEQVEGFYGKISSYIENGAKHYGCVNLVNEDGTYGTEDFAIALGMNVEFKKDDISEETDNIHFEYNVNGKTYQGFYILRPSGIKPITGKKIVGNDNPPNNTLLKEKDRRPYENMSVIVKEAPKGYSDLVGQILPIVIEIDNPSGGDGVRRNYKFRGSLPRRKWVEFDVLEISPDLYVAVSVFKD